MRPRFNTLMLLLLLSRLTSSLKPISVLFPHEVIQQICSRYDNVKTYAERTSRLTSSLKPISVLFPHEVIQQICSRYNDVQTYAERTSRLQALTPSFPSTVPRWWLGQIPPRSRSLGLQNLSRFSLRLQPSRSLPRRMQKPPRSFPLRIKKPSRFHPLKMQKPAHALQRMHNPPRTVPPWWQLKKPSHPPPLRIQKPSSSLEWKWEKHLKPSLITSSNPQSRYSSTFQSTTKYSSSIVDDESITRKSQLTTPAKRSTTVSTTASGSSFPAKPAFVVGWKVWSMWSECSQSCGGGQQMRVRQCEDGQYCEESSFEVENIICNAWECLDGVWGEWSSCEDGWHSRERCDEEWNCEFVDEECEEGGTEGKEGDGEWSDWGECDTIEGRRVRERCTEEFGCEEEQEECDREIAWSDWGPCDEGLQSRIKRQRDIIVEEEVMECFTGEWGVWGECRKEKWGNVKERKRCSLRWGCETEELSCGGTSELWYWTKWSECAVGFRSRQRCSPQGDFCFYEDVECEGSEEEYKWSEWGECQSGFQEREKCQDGECLIETKMCKGAIWTDWGACDSDGRQSRMIMELDVTVTEDRICSSDSWEEEMTDIYDSWEEESYSIDDGYWGR